MIRPDLRPLDSPHAMVERLIEAVVDERVTAHDLAALLDNAGLTDDVDVIEAADEAMRKRNAIAGDWRAVHTWVDVPQGVNAAAIAETELDAAQHELDLAVARLATERAQQQTAVA